MYFNYNLILKNIIISGLIWKIYFPSIFNNFPVNKVLFNSIFIFNFLKRIDGQLLTGLVWNLFNRVYFQAFNFFFSKDDRGDFCTVFINIRISDFISDNFFSIHFINCKLFYFSVFQKGNKLGVFFIRFKRILFTRKGENTFSNFNFQHFFMIFPFYFSVFNIFIVFKNLAFTNLIYFLRNLKVLKGKNLNLNNLNNYFHNLFIKGIMDTTFLFDLKIVINYLGKKVNVSNAFRRIKIRTPEKINDIEVKNFEEVGIKSFLLSNFLFFMFSVFSSEVKDFNLNFLTNFIFKMNFIFKRLFI